MLLLACWMMIGIGDIAHAGHIHPEKYYQQQWCSAQGGVAEYRLDDGTRVDCLTDTHAVEVDFARKWAESIGQALYYGLQTGKRPGVLLILESPTSDVWVISPAPGNQ